MSENVNGGLAFAATLDINDFKVSSEAMERRIRSVSDTAVQESERMEQSIAAFAQNGARYIIGTLVGGGMMGLVNSIVQTRGQFQQLQIAFDTMLGSGAKSKALMDQLTNTAAKTPFDLMGVAEGAKQLLAYGSSADKVNDTLVRLGNIASGLSIPLNDIVYLYGTTMVQGRLYAQDVRQFTGRGIPLVRELAAMYGKTAEEINTMVSEGKIGFPEVEKVINKMTDSGGQFYNLMEQQSKSLTGMISNLGDSWDMALNKLGEQNQGILESGISGAITVAKHLDDVLRVVKSIAVAYGSYRAAIVLNTLATKGYTGVSLIDNTVRQAKIALMKAEATLSGENVIIKKKMEQAEKYYVKSLQEKITLEQHDQALSQIRTEAVNDLLTAEQKRYLSNKGLTSSSKEYLQEAESVLTAEQKMALSRQNLDVNGRKYADTIADMAKKNESHVKALESEAKEISRQIPILEESKRSALQNLEIARAENLQAQSSTSAKRKLTAERNLAVQQQRVETITTELNTASKRKEAIQTELNTIASRKNTAAGVTDVATKTAQTGATNILTLATTGLKNALSAMWASMKANPLGWIVSLLGIAYSAYDMFFKKQEDGTETITGLAKATKDASEEFGKQAAKVDTLQKIVSDGNVAYFQRNKALDELKQIIPGYHAQLTKEGKLINDNTEAIQVYLTQLEKQIKLKAAQDELEAAYNKKRTLEKTESTQSDKYWDVRQTNTLQGYDRNGFTAKISRALGKLNDKNSVTDYLVPDFLTEKEDKAHRALTKTQTELKEVNNTIAELNNEITSTSQSMDESSKSTKSYSEQVSDAQKQVSTLKNELKELRSDKVAKVDLAAEIESKTKELKDAETKLSTLTGKSTPTDKSADTAADKAQQLAEKQIQAELKAEQSRIEIMDEGYAKRKALLELQHKQNIAQINKEEKELEKARREAGKGELSSKEKSEFDARRSNENASYSKAQNKLFDGEIEYKKSQYELYFRWVKNMGEDVANTYFKNLLKGGGSYKDYVEKEIQKLNEKKANGGLTEGETNNLINLNIQYDEITGAKTAMDTFKESVSQAINRASTLAEKIQAIADAKEKLKNGNTGLVGDDDKAAASVYLSQQDEANQKELNDKILKEYRTYEEQKKSIQDEYSMLRSQAQKMGDEERMKQISKAEAQELSALNGTFLKQSDSWQKLFQDMDSLTAGQIAKLVDDIQKQLNESDLKLNPVDYKAVIDSLNEAKDKMEEKNPFKALGKFFDDYVEAKKKLAKAKTDALSGKGSQKDVDDAQKEVKTAFKGITKSIQEVTGIATECGNSLASMFDALGNEDLASGLGTAMDLMGELGNAAASVGKIISGDIIGGVTGLVSSITSVISIFAKVHDAKYEKMIQNLQKEIDALEQSYSRLERAYNNTYWVFNDAQKSAFEKNVSLINDQIAALKEQARVAAQSWDFVRYAQLTKQIQELQSALSKAKEGDDMFGLYEQQKENLRKQQEDIKQQIQAEKEKKKSDDGKIKDWEEKIETINQQIEDLDQAMMETLAGTDVKSAIDEFADALVDAYVKGEDAADALGEKTKEVLKKAVVEALKRQFLAKAINDAVVYLGSAMEDNELTDEERAKFEAMVNAAGDTFNKALSGIGDWIKDTDTATTEDPTTGAVKSLSEETGGIVAGKLNAVVINQADGISVLRQSLIYHQQTAANTGASAAELKEIKATLNRIENKDSSLLSKGIGG